MYDVILGICQMILDMKLGYKVPWVFVKGNESYVTSVFLLQKRPRFFRYM